MGEFEEESMNLENNCEKDYWEVGRCSQQQGWRNIGLKKLRILANR